MEEIIQKYISMLKLQFKFNIYTMKKFSNITGHKVAEEPKIEIKITS